MKRKRKKVAMTLKKRVKRLVVARKKERNEGIKTGKNVIKGVTRRIKEEMKSNARKRKGRN